MKTEYYSEEIQLKLSILKQAAIEIADEEIKSGFLRPKEKILNKIRELKAET